MIGIDEEIKKRKITEKVMDKRGTLAMAVLCSEW